MATITIKTLSKHSLVVPIKNILFLEKTSEDNYYVYLPTMYVGVSKNQFNAVKKVLEGD